MNSMTYAAILAVAMSFGGISTSTTAEPGRVAVAPAVSAMQVDAGRALQQAVAFEREAEFASRPGASDKCSFKPSKNPLRQRKNECRLA